MPLTRSDLVKLQPGSATPVVKPLPSFPLREGDALVSADALPHTLLLLDIQQASLGGSSSSSSSGSGASSGTEGGDSQASQLYCTVRLESGAASAGSSPTSAGKPSPAASQRSMQGWPGRGGPAAPLRTRALPAGAGGVVAWQERLVLALPMRSGGSGWCAGAGLPKSKKIRRARGGPLWGLRQGPVGRRCSPDKCSSLSGARSCLPIDWDQGFSTGSVLAAPGRLGHLAQSLWLWLGQGLLSCCTC